MKTRTPYPLPYSNIHVEHKPARKPTDTPAKHDTVSHRCRKFYCIRAKSNICCSFCSDPCRLPCGNNNTACNCLTDIIGSRSTMVTIDPAE